jgi:tetratricopeptide (TPR) repeat protein
MPSGLKTKSSIPKHLLAIFIACTLVVFAFEIVLQTFHPNKISPDLNQSHYGLPVVLRANLDVELDWLHGQFYPPFRFQTNAQHFINDREFQYEKSPGVFRILMLGDSGFMGLGVEYNEVFSKNLGELLAKNAKGKEIEVINFSGVAWSSIQFLTFLKNEGYKYHPDLVIISQGENDFRVKYNELIEVNNISKEKLSDGRFKINLGELKINQKNDSAVSIIWETVRKLPFYLEASKYSQLLHQFRSKVNALWYYREPSKLFKSKQLGYFLETNNIEVTKDTLFSFNGNEFSIDPQQHSISFLAGDYSQSVFEAHANIALHSATQVKLSQTLNDLNSKLIVIDMPLWQQTLGIATIKKTRFVDSNLKNYFYLHPKDSLKKFQSSNIGIPLYFFNDHHLSPAGHRLMSILVYNFLKETALVPFLKDEPSIAPNSQETVTVIRNANNRIKDYIKNDKHSYQFAGLYHSARGNFQLAKENLTHYLEFRNDDFEIHYLLGRVLFNLNEFASALESFRKTFGGHHLELKKYHKAYVFTQTYKYAWENFQAGNLEQALAFGKKLETHQGDWKIQGLFLNYRINHKVGNLSEADQLITQVISLSPNNLKFLLKYSSLKFDLKNYKEAILSSQKILQINPNTLEALLILGLSHANIGNKPEAIKILTYYLVRDPKNKFAKYALGILQNR